MILTVKVKLLCSHEQALILKRTLVEANAACSFISELSYSEKVFHKFALHALAYRKARTRFPLISSDATNRAVHKVAQSYLVTKSSQHSFNPLGGFPYDRKMVTWKKDSALVSIWSVAGRLKIPVICNHKQKALLENRTGQSKLVLQKQKLFLFVSVNVTEQLGAASGWIGVDLGLVNLAQSSDGHTFGHAGKVAGIRMMRWRQRKRLQSKCTRSARRVLRRLRGRESRFIQDTNHVISKQICDVAKRTGRGIALEDLRGIRERIRARKNQRRILHSWAFYDLQSKIAYKGRLLGIPVKFIDPRNTSRTCPACGHIAKANRKTRDVFECVGCGFTADADTNGAENIRLAAINQPNARKGVREHVASLETAVDPRAERFPKIA